MSVLSEELWHVYVRWTHTPVQETHPSPILSFPPVRQRRTQPHCQNHRLEPGNGITNSPMPYYSSTHTALDLHRRMARPEADLCSCRKQRHGDIEYRGRKPNTIRGSMQRYNAAICDKVMKPFNYTRRPHHSLAAFPAAHVPPTNLVRASRWITSIWPAYHANLLDCLTLSH